MDYNQAQPFNEVTKWIDPEIANLEEEVHSYAEQIVDLEEELNGIEKMIIAFETRRTLQVGDLILRILNLRSRIAASKLKQQPNSAEIKEEFEQAKNEETEYKNSYNGTIENPLTQLTIEQQKELKTKYRRIANLIHEDKGNVDESFKKMAKELMIKANLANRSNDLNTIQEILDYLEKNIPFLQNNDGNKEGNFLRAKIDQLKSSIDKLKQKIIAIKQSETYQTVAQINNWDEYFAEVEQKLKLELQYLENSTYE